MKYQIPKTTFTGKPVAGSLERVLAGLNTNPNNPQNSPQTHPIVNAPNLSGYIFVPSINLYVAKERTLLNSNWNQAIEKIYNQGINVGKLRAEMPTLFEFMSYVKYREMVENAKK